MSVWVCEADWCVRFARGTVVCFLPVCILTRFRASTVCALACQRGCVFGGLFEIVLGGWEVYTPSHASTWEFFLLPTHISQLSRCRECEQIRTQVPALAWADLC